LFVLKKKSFWLVVIPPMLCLCITGAEADLKGSHSTEQVHPSCKPGSPVAQVSHHWIRPVYLGITISMD